MNGFMEKLAEVLVTVDDFVWGPVMLILLVGTGVFLTIRTGFRRTGLEKPWLCHQKNPQ